MEDDAQKNDNDDIVVKNDEMSIDIPKISKDDISVTCTSITRSTSFERSIAFSSFLQEKDDIERDGYDIMEFTTMMEQTSRTSKSPLSKNGKKVIDERYTSNQSWCVTNRKRMTLVLALILLGFCIVLAIEVLRSWNMI